MKKCYIIEKINSDDYIFDPIKLTSWLDCLPKTRHLEAPTTIKAGDVFMHPIFKHPYVVMRRKKGVSICCLLTSNGDFKEVLCKCSSRFFSESYITKTLFTLNESIGDFMGVYDNNSHLKKCYQNILEELK